VVNVGGPEIHILRKPGARCSRSPNEPWCSTVSPSGIGQTSPLPCRRHACSCRRRARSFYNELTLPFLFEPIFFDVLAGRFSPCRCRAQTGLPSCAFFNVMITPPETGEATARLTDQFHQNFKVPLNAGQGAPVFVEITFSLTKPARRLKLVPASHRLTAPPELDAGFVKLLGVDIGPCSRTGDIDSRALGETNLDQALVRRRRLARNLVAPGKHRRQLNYLGKGAKKQFVDVCQSAYLLRADRVPGDADATSGSSAIRNSLRGA
jgi:hypothetical protein